MRPEISVLMIVYNSEEFIEESVQSVLNQTFSNFELVLVNDGSVDNSALIINRLRATDKRIVLVNNDINLGRPKARNIALRNARGRYIAVLDSDDIALPQRLQKQYDFLEANPGVAVLGSGAYIINQQGVITDKKRPLTGYKKIAQTLAKRNCLIHSTLMFRNGLDIWYREKFIYSQDYDFYLLALSNNRNIENLPDALIKYRINPQAISWRKKYEQYLLETVARKHYHQRITGGSDNYHEFDYNVFLERFNQNPDLRIVWMSEIITCFELNDYRKMRKVCVKYMKKYGLFNKVPVFFAISFVNYRIINMLRKLK